MIPRRSVDHLGDTGGDERPADYLGVLIILGHARKQRPKGKRYLWREHRGRWDVEDMLILHLGRPQGETGDSSKVTVVMRAQSSWRPKTHG